MGSDSLPLESSPHVEQLLRALLTEVRGLRLVLEQSGAIDYGTAHEALLTSVRALLGDGEWTAGLLIQLAHCEGAAAAMVRHALAQLGLSDPFELGTYLRGRVGRTASGVELRRIGLGANKVQRWAVTAV